MSTPITSPPGDRLPWILRTTLARQALLVLLLLLLIFGFSRCSQNLGEEKAVEWLSMYNSIEVRAGKRITISLEDNANANGNANTGANVNTNANTGGTYGNENANANANANINANANVNGNTNAGSAGAGNRDQGAAGPTAPTRTYLPPNDDEQRRLDEQLGSIRARINHHGAVMAFFYKAYYMAISVVMLAGLLAALALFFIAQNGWAYTNPYVKTVFFVMTAATAYYGLFPTVFQQQQNISDNKALFLEYKALENEAVSYPITGGDIKGEAKSPPQFITYIDSELRRLGNIAIGFDYTKISYKGAFDIGDERTTGGANTNANTNATPPARKPPGQGQ